MGKDTMKITILPDGSLKVEVDPVSMSNHGNAEKMLLDMFKGIGADRKDIETKHKHGKGFHTHSHGEQHGESA